MVDSGNGLWDTNSYGYKGFFLLWHVMKMEWILWRLSLQWRILGMGYMDMELGKEEVFDIGQGGGGKWHKKKINAKNICYAPCEARTHDLWISHPEDAS